MKKHIEAEVIVLDRIMYLLEENSVSHLAKSDAKFQTFVHDLYKQLLDQSQKLQTTVA